MTVHFKTPPTLLDLATGTRAWLFDESATVVTQTSGDMTLAAARFMSTQVEDEVARRWVQAGKKVHYVHDWSSCANYDVEGRQVLIDWARHTRPHSLKSTIHISEDTSIFLRIAATTAVGLLRATGTPIELVSDLGPLCRALEP